MSRQRRRKGTRIRLTLLAANALFAVASAGIAWVAMRPVYESPRFDLAMAAAALIGVFASGVTLLAQWRGGIAALIAAALYLALALTFVIPSALSSVEAAGWAALEAVRAPVMGWSGLVTLPLPLGEYKATLVPPFALVVCAVALMVWVATRSVGRWALAAIPAVAMVIVAIAVGPAARAGAVASTPIGSLSREATVGIAIFATTLAWFVWRGADERRRAMLAAFGTATVSQVVRAPFRLVTGLVSAAAVIVVSLSLGILLGSPLAAGQPRDVARSTVEPMLAVDAAVSPLVGYRSYWADSYYDRTLFTVSTRGQLPDRIRLVTLSYFDGDTFSVSPAAGASALTFVRMPSPLDQGRGERVTVEVSIDGLAGLWVPVVGDVESVTPRGPRASDLLDGFYFINDIRTGIVTARGGTTTGDAFSVRGVLDAATPLADAGPSPEAPTIDAALIPESLRTWVDAQDVTRDAAGLAELVSRLRARGYLTHVSSLEAVGALKWADDVAGYRMVEAPAGHSYDRIDRLFTALNERETQVGAGGKNTELVAAAGDDEQFGVAVALLASQLGFPSRVVLGAHLVDTDSTGWTAEPCVDGRCTGANMSVWAEVRSQSGEWIAVDSTPQHVDPIAPEITSMREPEIPTVTDIEDAKQIVADPSLKGTSSNDEPAQAPPEAANGSVDAALIYAAVGAGGLMVLVGPFGAILAIKAVRRRRRRAGSASAAAHGGWDELVDVAVDVRSVLPRHATRAETADALGPASAGELAALADKTTFSWGATDDDAGVRAWALVAEARRELMASTSVWGRLRATVSTRSLRTRREAQVAGGTRSGGAPTWRSSSLGTTRRPTRVATVSRRRRKAGV